MYGGKEIVEVEEKTGMSPKPFIIILVVFGLVLIFYALWYYTAGPGYRSGKLQNWWNNIKNTVLSRNNRPNHQNGQFDFRNYIKTHHNNPAPAPIPIPPPTVRPPRMSPPMSPPTSPPRMSPRPQDQPDTRFPLMQDIMSQEQSPRPFSMSEQ